MGSELIRLADLLDLPEETVPERQHITGTSETMFPPEPVSASSQDEATNSNQAIAAGLIEIIHTKERLSTQQFKNIDPFEVITNIKTIEQAIY